jgi:arginyl-tRNA--protein-N-Asp/Glu arginylyltransferase
MMFAEAHFPKVLSHDELDQSLALGWFRMGQTIFTTNFLNLRNEFYSAIWLRIILSDFEADDRQIKVNRMNKHFRTEIRKATVTPQKEILFTRYKTTVSFDASPSLQQLLFGHEQYNIYDTWEINVFDGDKLIASGFFDLGKKSAAGITSFYDPEYKKYSLGKYLIYQKIEYCKNLDLDFFYPGYFAPGYGMFDYKLRIGSSSLQFLQLSSESWQPISTFSDEDIPLKKMNERLLDLQQRLGKDYSILKYAYFEANLLSELEGIGLFDYPIFMNVPEIAENELSPVVVFDPRDNCYHLLKCVSVWRSGAPSEPGIYSLHLLKIEEDLFITANAQQLTEVLKLVAQRAKNLTANPWYKSIVSRKPD